MSADPVVRSIKEAAQRASGRSEARVLDPRDPLRIAREFVGEHYTTRHGKRVLRDWRGELVAWTGTHYRTVEDAALRAELYAFLEDAERPVQDGTKPFKPTTTVVNNVLDALRAVAHLHGSTNAPAWLDGREDPDPHELVAMENGVLHMPSRRLLPHSSDLFVTGGLPFAYAPDAPEPVEFFRFLSDLWPDDPESIETVREMFAYLVSGETRLQKMFLLVGPLRGGKGTLARLLRALMGDANVAGPTLSSLATNFGLQSLIGKPLAVVSDARLSGRTDETVIVERLLSITGQDLITVDRKHRDPWIGQLPTRFLILTNELPRLSDTSGALARRFVTLTLTRSWYGKEDPRLFDRLAQELPGIFNWTLDGLVRLQERERFEVPQASKDAMQELEDLSSPVGAFVRDCCDVEPGAEVVTSTLYKRWRAWCEDHGRSHPTTEQVFGRDLRAAVPGLSTSARKQGADRWRVYVGIRLEGL